ncbi:MAG: hypothetical protein ACI8W7_003675, partial [Gammaproteobacteria bacterium]
MKNKSGKNTNPTSKNTKFVSAKQRYPSWRALLVMAGLLAVSAAGLAAYKKNWEQAHDLSVIGNGVHTIVQIHDSGCRLCRALKSNSEKALARMDANIQFLIADINTGEGRQLQHKHEVPHVTLLLFGPDGKLWRTLTGVKDAETLQHVFEQFTGRSRA